MIIKDVNAKCKNTKQSETYMNPSINSCIMCFLKIVQGGLAVYIIIHILPSSRFAKLPSPAIDLKIWKALYSRGWVFGVTLLTF